MIQAKDLRLGNIVLDKQTNIVCEICSINHDGTLRLFCRGGNVGANIEEIQPIPLTEDILLKCEKVYKSFNDYSVVYVYEALGTAIYLIPSLDKWHFVLSDIESEKEFEISDCYELAYLHEYQNLIFALTKQELEVKL